MKHDDVNRWTTGRPLCGDAATRDYVLLALEAVQRGDGAEGLLVGDAHVGRHIGQDRRLKERAADRRPLAAGHDLGALLDASAMCALTFSTAFMLMSGPITAPGSNPSATFMAPAVSARRLGNGIVDAVLHQDAVGADAGLAGVAVFRGDRTLDRGLDIGVVEHNERRIAAELQREGRPTAPSDAHDRIRNLDG